MNTPGFTWRFTSPDTPGGTATFTVGTQLAVVSFDRYEDALNVHRVMCAAQLYGAECGQRALAQFVQGAVKDFLR